MTELYDFTWPNSKRQFLLFYKAVEQNTRKIYEDWFFNYCKMVQVNDDLVVEKKSWGKHYSNFHHGIGDALYIDEAFLQCLHNVGEQNFQIFPIKIMPEAKPYYILNLLNLVDAVDREKSKFTLWTEEDERPDLLGTFHTFEKMVLDRSKVPKNVHFFRLKGYEVVTVITKELAAEFKKNNIKGFSLKPLG
jgi:hypothetical protein